MLFYDDRENINRLVWLRQSIIKTLIVSLDHESNLANRCFLQKSWNRLDWQNHHYIATWYSHYDSAIIYFIYATLTNNLSATDVSK